MDPKERRIADAALRLFFRHGYRKVTMMDIAAEAGMSRPSLYAAFPNKEAIYSALVAEHTALHAVRAEARLRESQGLRQRLACLFDEWIVEPFASVIDSENSADMLANTAQYAPAATAALYARFESQLREVLEPEMAPGAPLSARDLAYLLMMATRGLKAASSTLEELRRLTNGIVDMAVATARSGGYGGPAGEG